MFAGVPAPLALPARMGRYDLIAKIAEGGMATVYLARLSGPMGFARPVAVKVMRPEFVQSQDFVKMFLDEARLVARLQHPNVVQLLELGQDDSPIGRMHGGFFIVMELLQGESLLDTWYACQDRRLMLPYDLIAWIGARAAEGLHHAHEQKDAHGQSLRIVHRDVNPGNIFLTYDGQVKVIDFGVAKAMNRLTGATSMGTLKGKVAYMAPEQAKSSDVDRRSDVFSLAVTLWELTTDRRLFKRKTDVDTILAVTEAQVPDPTQAIPDYPPALWSVLRRALSRDREQRQQSALELSRDLDQFAQTQGRTVNAAVLAEIMRYMFSEQMHRYETWLRQATHGESSEVLRSVDPRRVQMQMQSFDAVPLSARSGEMILSRADFVASAPVAAAHPHHAPPPVPAHAPPHAHFGQTLPLQQPQYAPPPTPQVQPQHAQPQPAEEPPQKSRASTVIFMLIAVLALLGIGGFVAWRVWAARQVAQPAPSASVTVSSAPSASAAPSAEASASASPSAVASAEALPSAIPTLDLSAPPEAGVVPAAIVDSGSAAVPAPRPSASAVTPPTPRPRPSSSATERDVLRSRE